MDDLISRQAAIDAIMEEPSETRYPVFYAEKIRQLPSAQRKGRWKRINDDIFADLFACSECGKLAPIENFEWWLSDFCPNCGSEMEKEKE